MSSSPSDVRPSGAAEGNARGIDAGERPTLVEVLVEAFAGDPWFRWLYPGEDYPAQARAWFGLVADRVWPRAEAYLAGEAEAAALWVRPSEPVAEVDDLVAVAGLLERQLGERAVTVLEGIASTGGHVPAERHATCLYVGVRPGARGRGLGREVMRPVLDRLDRAGTPAFLNSTNERNLPFYRRLGFEVLAEVEAVPGLILRPMLRRPPATGA